MNLINDIPTKREFNDPMSNYNIRTLAHKLLQSPHKKLPLGQLFHSNREAAEIQFKTLESLLQEKGWGIVQEKVIDEKRVARARNESNVGYNPQEDFGNITEKRHYDELERRKNLSDEEIANEFNLFNEFVRIY